MSHIRVKMCGMTRKQDIYHAAAIGADAIGLIFYPKSPRAITLERAIELTQSLPVFLDVVAVFVNSDRIFIEKVIDAIKPHYLQFHGEESADFCTQFGKPYIKAIAADSKTAILNGIDAHYHAAAVLLDSPSKTVRGGSGIAFDWRIIPQNSSLPVILAGGLSPENIGNAVNQTKIHAVDVCSGIESTPGIKDHQKMDDFIKALRVNRP